MALGVLNNLSAIYAENNLNNTNTSLQNVLRQLSSGSRINSGADDAAGLSLVNGLQANASALAQSKTNATEGVGLLEVADGALSQVTALLDRAITLATEASNGTLNPTQESAANQEYQSILAEINNIGSTTTYNQQAVFSGKTISIYTGDSSMTGSSIIELNIRTLSEASVGDTGGVMSYSSGQNNVFLNLSTTTKNATLTDTLNASGTSTVDVSYLVKGSNGSSNTATTSISVGGTTGYANTVDGLINAINDSGLGLTATFTTQEQAGVTGGGTQTGIEISGGMLSAGVDPSAASTSGMLDGNGIPADQLLTQGQTVTVKVGTQTAAVVTVSPSVNTLQEVADQINANAGGTPGLVTASVITNGDGSQSLSLSVTAGGGALSVTTTGGTVAAIPTVSTPTTSAPQVSMNSVTGNTAGIAANPGSYGSLTLGVAANGNGIVDGASDTVTGQIVLTDGSGAAQTFVMGGAGATTTVGNTTTVQGNNLSDLAAAIQAVFVANGDTGATATVGSSGLVVTAGTLGNSITLGANSLVNTDASIGLYTPGAAGGTVFNTGLVAMIGSGGTTIDGTIGAGDTLVGSIVIQDGAGTAQTFVMGGVGATSTVGNVTTVQGNSMANLISAINGVTTAIGGPSFAIAATADTSSGGMYLQSGTLGNALTVTGDLADGYAENNVAANPVGQAVVVGSSTVALLGPSGGTVNTTDVLTGQITITNAGQTHTFTMGASAYDSSSAAAAGLGTTTLTVNGNTIADLARAISADTTLGLTGLASTAGLQLTSGPTGAAIGLSGSNTLMDTTQGTNSIVTLGPFASQKDTVSGSINFTVGGVAQTITAAAGETVQAMIARINQNTATLGVSAQWVAGTNGYGSLQLTSTATGVSGQISAATTTVTDTAPTASLTYTSTSAYNIGLSSDSTYAVYNSTAGQNSTTTAATFVANMKAGSGVAVTSYSDGAGEALNGTNLLNQANAQSALAHLNRAITDVAAQDGYIGAEINTLNSISHVMSTQQENVVSAQNALQATDYASATSDMSKYEILSQTGIAALAQANSVQQEVTKLLQ